jgi:hypothetical protein
MDTAKLSPHLVMGRPVLSMVAVYEHLGTQLGDDIPSEVRLTTLSDRRVE